MARWEADFAPHSHSGTQADCGSVIINMWFPSMSLSSPFQPSQEQSRLRGPNLRRGMHVLHSYFIG